MSDKKYDNISEEDFLKNKAKRKAAADKASGKKKKKKSSMHPALRGFLIALCVLVGVIVIAASAAAIYYFAVINSGAPDDADIPVGFPDSEDDSGNRITATDGSKKYYTFLATATDRGGSLTDVIMVARFHFDSNEPEVSVLQIPRDTYVRICGNKLLFTKDGYLSPDNFYGEGANLSIKINEAFQRGRGLASDSIDKMLAEVDGKSDSEIEKILEKKEYLFIEADAKKVKSYAKEKDNTQKNKIYKNILKDFGITYLQNLIYYNYGIPTDYHAQVNINGFRGVVNAIGGVELNVPTRMYYEDEYQDLLIDLYPGKQTLNGDKAEQFVRFRGYPGGDVARLDAQKLFINAFLDKILSVQTVTKIDDIITEIQSNLYTNISFNNLLKFANILLNIDPKNDVHLYTLPGAGEYIGPVSYFVADKDETMNLVNQQFNVFNTPLIAEDFKMLDANTIYRPASAVDDTADDDERSVDGNDDAQTTDNPEDDESSENENSGNNHTEENENENNTDEGTASDENDVDDSLNQNNTSDTSDNSGSTGGNHSASESNRVPSENPDTTSGNGNSQNSEEGTQPGESVDENYQLLLDMVA